MHNFRELKIWQRSRNLVKSIYTVTKSFPDQEIYTLTREVRRSSISIPSNIAEGCGRTSDKELSRFLDIAIGSAYELETQLVIASDLEFLSEKDAKDLIVEIQEIEKMIFNFKQKLLKS